MTDEFYMNKALTLAKRGLGKVSPNPAVGAVIVKDGRIIGSGYHARYGAAHAERNALDSCVCSPCGADMYVTLAPCAHVGKQPPCADAIVIAGISRVFIGSPDPNEKVNGKGVAILREHGITVAENVLRERCDKLNENFFHYIRTGTPFVLLKYAMTADGKIADASGESKWITGEIARRHVHKTRNAFSAIMVGVNTVLRDDPMLTCRIRGGVDPIRVVCDTRLRTPLDSSIMATARSVRTVIATCSDDTCAISEYERRGAEVLRVRPKNGRVDLRALTAALGQMNVDGIMIEGGGELAYSALEEGIVGKIHAYVSPKLLGGRRAATPIGGDGFGLNAARKLKSVTMRRLGEDMLIEGYL